MLQMYAPNIVWDKEILKGDDSIDSENILPITVIRHKGSERSTLEKLISILGVHGFTSETSGYIGGILGELADNCMTHSHEFLSERICFLQAQRHSFKNNSHCLVVAIADVGQGVAESLRKNPKHQSLTDEQAILSSFKHKISSWPDEALRGKGLTDTLGLTMGNKGLLRIASGNKDFSLNFVESSNGKTFKKCTPPLIDTNGTRIGIFYIDHKFQKITREEVSKYINKLLEQ